MIRTLQIISILALGTAGLTLTLCVTDSRREGSVTEQAGMSSAVERFMQGDGKGTTDGSNDLAPLIQQAQAFALYLNPPVRPASSSGKEKDQLRQPVANDGREITSATRAKPVSSSPKFELHGISYYRSDPQRSMALVYEPGGGRRWVRQGTQLGHLVVERIDSDSIVYREGAQTLVMALAACEVLERFAKVSGSTSAPKQAVTVIQTKPAPPPMRGIRQMPVARVAAKMGVPLSQLELPGGRQVQSE
jgi:hypothetical protein